MNDVAIGPTRPGIGHNHPPAATLQLPTLTMELLLDPGMVREQLEAEHADLLAAARANLCGAARLFATAARVPVVTAELAAGQPVPNGMIDTARHAASLGRDDAPFILLDCEAGPILLGPGPGGAWTEITRGVQAVIGRLKVGAALPNDDTAVRATSFVRQLKDSAKPLEARRREAKAPYDGAAAAVQGVFASQIEALTAAARTIERDLITPYATAKAAETRRAADEAAARTRAEADAKLAEAEALMQKQDAPAADLERALDDAIAAGEEADRASAVAAAGPTERLRGSHGGTAAHIQRWSYEIIDPNQVPREFLMIDHDKLTALARTKKGGAAVPGVRFFSTTTVSVR